MLEFIQDAIYTVTGKKGVTYDTDFIKDLALNSFDIMNIIVIFEDHFDISIQPREVWHLHLVRDVIEYLEERGIPQP